MPVVGSHALSLSAVSLLPLYRICLQDVTVSRATVVRRRGQLGAGVQQDGGRKSVRSDFTGVFKNLNFIAACIIKRLWRSGDGERKRVCE